MSPRAISRTTVVPLLLWFLPSFMTAETLRRPFFMVVSGDQATVQNAGLRRFAMPGSEGYSGEVLQSSGSAILLAICGAQGVPTAIFRLKPYARFSPRLNADGQVTGLELVDRLE